jgi:anti-anti-sigma factor
MERLDEHVVLHVGGELDLATCPQLADAIEPHLVSQQTLILSMANVQFMDSSCLHVLEHAQQMLAADGGSLILRSPSGATRRLLTAACADHLLDAIESSA